MMLREGRGNPGWHGATFAPSKAAQLADDTNLLLLLSQSTNYGSGCGGLVQTLALPSSPQLQCCAFKRPIPRLGIVVAMEIVA